MNKRRVQSIEQNNKEINRAISLMSSVFANGPGGGVLY